MVWCLSWAHTHIGRWNVTKSCFLFEKNFFHFNAFWITILTFSVKKNFSNSWYNHAKSFSLKVYSTSWRYNNISEHESTNIKVKQNQASDSVLNPKDREADSNDSCKPAMARIQHPGHRWRDGEGKEGGRGRREKKQKSFDWKEKVRYRNSALLAPEKSVLATHLSTASTSKQNLFSMESVFRRVQDLRVTDSSSP